ncbi:MAG: DUF3106 domain-containing protein [bacterium]|nr:DUF3106 domain-containing protein [bacterium]
MKRATRSLLASAVCGLLLLASPARAEEPHRPTPEEVRRDAPLSLRSWIAGLPEEQRRGAIRRLRNMPPRRRAEFFERWKGMSEGERTAFTQRMERRIRRNDARADGQHRRAMRERMAEMSPPRRRQFRRQLKQWQGLERSEQDKLRRRLHHFRKLTAEEQKALVEEQFSSRSTEERAGILEGLRAASSALD